MEMIALVPVIMLFSYVLRIYLTVKHPHIRDAWDEVEARRIQKRNEMLGSSAQAGLWITKFLIKK